MCENNFYPETFKNKLPPLQNIIFLSNVAKTAQTKNKLRENKSVSRLHGESILNASNPLRLNPSAIPENDSDATDLPTLMSEAYL